LSEASERNCIGENTREGAEHCGGTVIWHSEGGKLRNQVADNENIGRRDSGKYKVGAIANNT
jgi:hypothetical protein